MGWYRNSIWKVMLCWYSLPMAWIWTSWFYAVKLFSKTACQVCEGQHQWDVDFAMTITFRYHKWFEVQNSSSCCCSYHEIWVLVSLKLQLKMRLDYKFGLTWFAFQLQDDYLPDTFESSFGKRVEVIYRK
jgi:hypothetical protein